MKEKLQISEKWELDAQKKFTNYNEAKKWRYKTIEAISSHLPYETTQMRRITLGELIDRYIALEMDEDSINDQTRLGQLNWWKQEIDHYVLIKVTEYLFLLARLPAFTKRGKRKMV